MDNFQKNNQTHCNIPSSELFIGILTSILTVVKAAGIFYKMSRITECMTRRMTSVAEAEVFRETLSGTDILIRTLCK